MLVFFSDQKKIFQRKEKKYSGRQSTSAKIGFLAGIFELPGRNEKKNRKEKEVRIFSSEVNECV